MKDEFWWDYKHNDDGTMSLGIECTDSSLTFDGHYICIIPVPEGESHTNAIARAEKLVALLNFAQQPQKGEEL